MPRDMDARIPIVRKNWSRPKCVYERGVFQDQDGCKRRRQNVPTMLRRRPASQRQRVLQTLHQCGDTLAASRSFAFAKASEADDEMI